jgi:hypothetical protein
VVRAIARDAGGAAVSRFPKLRLTDTNLHGPKRTARIGFLAFRSVKQQR